MLIETEKLHSKVRRYTSPEEHAFYPSILPPPILPQLNFPNISLRKAISYYELPELLATYDIGLVLYKGIFKNHIYCVPNKIYEYLVCGLEVFCSSELISTAEFKMKFAIDNLHIINFDNLANSQFDIFDDSERKYYSFEKCNSLINKFK